MLHDSQLIPDLPNSPIKPREAPVSFPWPHQEMKRCGRYPLREDTLEFKGDRDRLRATEETIQPAMSGDREALGRLLASHMPQLYRAALRILGTHEEAEEALQDGLVQVVQHFREFEGRSRLSTWLTRIVINASLMRLRRSRPEVMTSIDQTVSRERLSLAESFADSRPSPEEAYAREEQLQLLRQELWTLPVAYRSVLWLRDVQGLSTREAAEALRIPVGSLKSRLHRARQRLRTELSMAHGTCKALQTHQPKRGTTQRRFASKPMGQVVRPAA
jgi:RNA polymerase sigma-70 factor (ECF subfamily)